MEFRGNAGLFVRQVLIVTLILGPLFAIFAVGAAWIRIFLLSLLVFAPFLALLYFAIKRWDRLSFDDQRGAAVLPLRGSIPYQKIPAFEVVTAGPSFHVDAKFGRFLRLRFLASVVNRTPSSSISGSVSRTCRSARGRFPFGSCSWARSQRC